MDRIYQIEYCTGWGYVPKAVGLASVLLENLKNKILKVELIPSDGGVFEVTLNGELIFSKKEVGRFPSDDEINSFL